MKKIIILLMMFIGMFALSFAEYESNFDINAVFVEKSTETMNGSDVLFDMNTYERGSGLVALSQIDAYPQVDTFKIFLELKKKALANSLIEDYETWGYADKNVYFRARSIKKGSIIHVFYIEDSLKVFTFNDSATTEDFDQLMTYIKMNGLLSKSDMSYINFRLISQRMDLALSAIKMTETIDYPNY